MFLWLPLLSYVFIGIPWTALFPKSRHYKMSMWIAYESLSFLVGVLVTSFALLSPVYRHNLVSFAACYNTSASRTRNCWVPHSDACRRCQVGSITFHLRYWSFRNWAGFGNGSTSVIWPFARQFMVSDAAILAKHGCWCRACLPHTLATRPSFILHELVASRRNHLVC